MVEIVFETANCLSYWLTVIIENTVQFRIVISFLIVNFLIAISIF